LQFWVTKIEEKATQSETEVPQQLKSGIRDSKFIALAASTPVLTIPLNKNESG